MPEIVADPPSLSCYHLFFERGIDQSQRLAPDLLMLRARDARGRFAKGRSGNPRGRPPVIPNPPRRVPSTGCDPGIAARPLSAKALSDQLARRPQLLRALVKQLLPPPASIDPAERVGIELSAVRTPRDCRQVLANRSRRLIDHCGADSDLPARFGVGAREIPVATG